MHIIDGKTIARKINEQTKKKIAQLRKKNIYPVLGIVLVGKNPESEIYVRKKQKKANELGITCLLKKLPTSASVKKIQEVISELQNTKFLSGILIQLPLPKNEITEKILNTIDPLYDIDCLTHARMGMLYHKNPALLPPTVDAILAILSHAKTNFFGMHAVIMGNGLLVGKPLATVLQNKGVTVTVCDSKTKNPKTLSKQGDILVTGIGKKHFITDAYIKKGAVVIDAGTEMNGPISYGDVLPSAAQKKAGWFSPVPGGVGPVTVAKLLGNLAKNAKILYGRT